MPRLQLRIYIEPGAAEIFCNVLRKDGDYERFFAVIDTGAEVSLLPYDLLELVDYRPSQRTVITIEQAGVAKQAFQAVEGYAHIMLEDYLGQSTQPFEIRAWFADTNHALIGFADVLDRAVLHIDMPQREGWLEINP